MIIISQCDTVLTLRLILVFDIFLTFHLTFDFVLCFSGVPLFDTLLTFHYIPINDIPFELHVYRPSDTESAKFVSTRDHCHSLAFDPGLS